LYLALMESGSLKVAASDFRIVEQSLSVPFVLREMGEPEAEDFLVLDANLSSAVLGELVRTFAARMRVVFEPVSVEKSARHAASLRDLFLLTPTQEEMDSLAGGGAGAAGGDYQEYRRARSISNMLITRGREGADLYDGEGQEYFPPEHVVEAPDTTGAGDLLLASLVSFLHGGQPMRQAVRSAMRKVESRLTSGDPL
ncbi:MAG TPA: PfkB family carbohydrate kinase, partial [Spirochaetia bacterium]|nr:PfkB family carbohydrate kinase [Spirochaetia bacterium]